MQLNDQDARLWKMARKRAGFKSHLMTYVLINLFLWAMWYFTGQKEYNEGMPWPLFTTIGWGIGVAMHFAGTYCFPRFASAEHEFQKLKTKNNQ